MSWNISIRYRVKLCSAQCGPGFTGYYTFRVPNAKVVRPVKAVLDVDFRSDFDLHTVVANRGVS
jgi:hypothetical protein